MLPEEGTVSISEIEQKIKRVIARYAMLPSGCTVVVGFSGGADSAALTHFLFSHREEYGVSVVAAHVNHGLRSAAGHDEEAARSFCEKRGIPFYCRCADVAALALSLIHILSDRKEDSLYGLVRIGEYFLDKGQREAGKKPGVPQTRMMQKYYLCCINNGNYR